MDRFIDFVFSCALVLIVFAMIIASAILIDKIYHHYQQEHAQVESTKGWTPPRIPDCDKELWDRIRGEC